MFDLLSALTSVADLAGSAFAAPARLRAHMAHDQIISQVDFSAIRYAQCWEDADVLLAALDVQPGDTCLSIASAGDNTLALLSRNPGRVIALDINPAQLACLALRVAAYRTLSHHELLELLGVLPSTQRPALYRRCRPLLAPDERRFWDARPATIAAGIGGAGKFERYFGLFRRAILPLIHRRATVARLLRAGTTAAERAAFYREHWDTWRWRLLFRLFFSRAVLGRLGRDPRLFTYVEGSVAERILARTRYALTMLDPPANPYLHWILTGTYGAVLPHALRPEHFATIRANLDRLEWRQQSLEDYLATAPDNFIDRSNLSDIFEYMSAPAAEQALAQLARVGRRGGRLAYWNMLVPRSRPAALASQLCPLTDLAERLHLADNAFFYSAFIVEEVL